MSHEICDPQELAQQLRGIAVRIYGDKLLRSRCRKDVDLPCPQVLRRESAHMIAALYEVHKMTEALLQTYAGVKDFVFDEFLILKSHNDQ
jgi:hypothetical protein